MLHVFLPQFLRFNKAVKNEYFQSWPGLSTSLITKFLKPSIATHFGHLNEERQNLQSTQQLSNEDAFPTPEMPNHQTHEMMVTITPYTLTLKIYGDLPGKFPYTSSRGARYFWVVYHYDSNAILVKTLKIDQAKK